MTIQSTSSASQVLPRVPIVQRADGAVLRDATSGCQTTFLLIFAVLWNLVSWPLALVFFFTRFTLFSPGRPSIMNFATLGFLLIPAIFCIIGLVLIFIVARRLLVGSQFNAAELVVSQWPLRLGESANITFRRSATGFVQVEQIEARLRCVESATYSVGTDKRTVTEIVYDAPLSSIPMLVGMKQAEANWRIEIPRDGMASFDTFNNSVNWQVVVTLRSSRFPDANSTFTLVVLPEVVA